MISLVDISTLELKHDPTSSCCYMKAKPSPNHRLFLYSGDPENHGARILATLRVISQLFGLITVP
jgi:hypothetical protein